ncbi:hypothetical protein [Caudoviricetes sp.]|nr:hypothetical protein [Caudoviricetes sp.]
MRPLGRRIDSSGAPPTTRQGRVGATGQQPRMCRFDSGARLTILETPGHEVKGPLAARNSTEGKIWQRSKQQNRPPRRAQRS